MVLQDTLPEELYYSLALDMGTGPLPDTVTANPDGTTTLTWDIGSVAAGSSEQIIEYTARPSLLLLAGDMVSNNASLTFTDNNGNEYPELMASASTEIIVVAPTQYPRSLGFRRNHPDLWSDELLARIQATDQRYDGVNGSTADGSLSASEVDEMYASAGTCLRFWRCSF